MNSWLLFLLKSTLVLNLLYLFFRLLMRNETFFRISRTVLLSIVFASVVIPFINLRLSYRSTLPIKLEPLFQRNTVEHVQMNEPVSIYPSVAGSDKRADENLTETVLLFVYLAGVFISIFLLVSNFVSLLRLFKKARKTNLNGIRLMILNEDITAFSLRKRIMISQYDYYNNAETILTHELSHVRQGHFYDLFLMRLVKIIYWFNPLVYLIGRNLKDIHEYQADEFTLNSGIDTTKYQLLLIQKCVGHQSFALANSFNNYQIKKRIAMINKSKTGKAWRWKSAAFLPAIALLLMAFGKRGEILPEKNDMLEITLAPAVIVQKQNPLTDQIIEIRKDGNYINNQQCSLEEIVAKGKEWMKKGNDWTLLLCDVSIPIARIDEVRETLRNADVDFVTQATVGSDDIVYPMGDVSEFAELKQGTWDDWMVSQLKNYSEIISKSGKFTLSFGYIIGRDGKVRDGHIIKRCDYPEINSAFEKILTQIPDWEPAKKADKDVSVYVSVYYNKDVEIEQNSFHHYDYLFQYKSE